MPEICQDLIKSFYRRVLDYVNKKKKPKHYVILLKVFAYGFKGGEASLWWAGTTRIRSDLHRKRKRKTERRKEERTRKSDAASGRETEEDGEMRGER